MSSELRVNVLRGSTANGNITIQGEGTSNLGGATMQLQQGLCKTWIKYTDHVGDGAGLAIADDLNVSTVADTASGQVTVTFTNNMSSIDFCYNVMAYDMGSRMLGYSGYIGDQTSTYIATSKLLVWTAYDNNDNGGVGTIDSDIAMVTIHGDLA